MTPNWRDRRRQTLVYFGLASEDPDQPAPKPERPTLKAIVAGFVVTSVVYGLLQLAFGDESPGGAALSGLLFGLFWSAFVQGMAWRAWKRSQN